MNEKYTKTFNYLKANPEDTELFEQIIEFETQYKNEENYMGWTSQDVRETTRKLKKIYNARIIDIKYQSNRYLNYELADHDATKQALIDIKTPHVDEYPTEMPKDLFDNIINYDEIKKVLIRGIESEKPVHFMLIGAVATAKSMFLSEFERIPNSVLTLGGTSTKVGIFDILYEEEPKFLLIDEIDKMDRTNLSVLLSLCQNGEIKKIIHGEVKYKKLNTKVIASGNRIHKIPEEILSRFAKFHFSTYSEEDAINVMYLTLTNRENIEESHAMEIARCTIGILRSHDIRDAIRIARLSKSKEDVKSLVELLSVYKK